MQSRHRGPIVLGFVLFVVPGRRGPVGRRAAHDLRDQERRGDLRRRRRSAPRTTATSSFERRDLERFEGLYHSGPGRHLLKRGSSRAANPSTSARRCSLSRSSRRLSCASRPERVLCPPRPAARQRRRLRVLFLAAQISPLAAALFAAAFFGASALPVYLVFLMPEILNVALVIVAYFLWLYKEVAPGSALNGPWTDYRRRGAAWARNLFEAAPRRASGRAACALPWLRRRWELRLAVGAVAVPVCAAWLCIHCRCPASSTTRAATGGPSTEPSRSMGPTSTWDSAAARVTTDDIDGPEALSRRTAGAIRAQRRVFPRRPALRVRTLFLSRRCRRSSHGCCVRSAPRPLAPADLRGLRRGARRHAAAVAAVDLERGRRPDRQSVLLSVYPVLLFLMPPASTRVGAGVVAWGIGALFTAKMLANPFVAAKLLRT